ncbi:MAG: TIGR03013 family XrtA/PEP-CTERM system glycosyltransferase [Candidatus Acidiferrales bacterium]
MLKIGGQKVPPRTLILLASDGILIVLGIMFAIVLRFHSFHAIWNYLRPLHTIPRFFLVATACGVALYYNDLYNREVITRHFELFLRLLQALGTACLELAILYYFAPDLSLGRGIAVFAAPAILILLFGWRIFLDYEGLILGTSERVLVLGTGPAGISVVREILSKPELHMSVVGFLDEKGENIGKSLVNPGIIGAASDLESVVAAERIDRVILSLKERRGRSPMRELLHLKFAGVSVEDAHSFHERITGLIPLENLSPSWLVLSEGFHKSPPLLAAKRTIDIIASLIVLVVTLPIMGIVAAAIWLETGTPILFRQERTGLGGQSFEIWKFRSMRQDAEANGPSWATSDDSRITKVGRFIRKTRLDELPQIFNVLRGEMSLVGPRPERPFFCRQLEEATPYYVLRHTVRPGITGWAQVKYQYGSTIEESKTKLEYDIFYIKHLSLFLDVAILFETAKVILYGRGAK